MGVRDKGEGILPLISNYFPGQKLLSGLDKSKVGVIICDRRFRYSALNPRIAEIHNVPMEALLGHSFHKTLGGLAEKVVPFWETVFSTGRPLAKVDINGKLPKRLGEGRWIESLFPLEDDKGRIKQVGGIIIEVTATPAARSHLSRPVGGAKPVTGNPTPSSDPSACVLLSDREREVLRLVAEGKANKEISSILEISVRTVETYRSRLMLKLHATSVVHLVHYAIQNGIVTL